MTTLQQLFDKRIALAAQDNPGYKPFVGAAVSLLGSGATPASNTRTPRQARQCLFLGEATGRMIEVTTFN